MIDPFQRPENDFSEKNKKKLISKKHHEKWNSRQFYSDDLIDGVVPSFT